MITPTTITNYNRTEAELEEFLMFAILVAGKGAEQQAKKLESFINPEHKHPDVSPFDYLHYLFGTNKIRLRNVMRHHKLGQYNRLEWAFSGILAYQGHLKTISIEQLESVYGIGSKTARFFVLHSRADAKVACLDTHILKWLNEKGYKVPKATPPKNKYKEIEKLFLQEAINHQMTPADLDLQIWKSYAI